MALSMSNTIKAASNLMNTAEPISSQYSVIQRRDSDVSTCHSEDDNSEAEKEGQSAIEEQIMSQYSVVTRENMDHVSEASDSEDSHTYSVAAEPVQNDDDLVEEKSDF